MRMRALASVGALAGAVCGGGGPAPTGTMEVAVSSYDVAFDLDTRHATADLTATVTTAGDCLTVPFRAENLSDTRLDGAPAGGHIADDLLTLCGAGWDVGATIDVHAQMDVALA